jgi:hypothetical protein
LLVAAVPWSLLSTCRLSSHVCFGCPLKPCTKTMLHRVSQGTICVGTDLSNLIRYPPVLAPSLPESCVKPIRCTSGMSCS